jgi:hypothetical protein
MTEPHKESCIVASIFHHTAPAHVACKNWKKGVVLEWNFYIGRGYPTGLARADFSDLHGLINFQISRHGHRFPPDFQYIYQDGDSLKPVFRVQDGRLRRPTTTLALRYLLAKNVDISPFESQFNHPIDYHTRMEWGLCFSESHKRWTT